MRFQAAASDSAAGPFTFVGPDGTAATSFSNPAPLAQLPAAPAWSMSWSRPVGSTWNVIGASATSPPAGIATAVCGAPIAMVASAPLIVACSS